MGDVFQLLLTILLVLTAAYAPGFVAVRILGGSRLLAAALAPALGAMIAGGFAVVAAMVGVRWSLMPFTVGALLVIAAAYCLRRCGVSLPRTAVLDGLLSPRGSVPGARLWLIGAVTIAVAPIALHAGRPDAVLERWDTLYHLSALARVRESGTASSFDLGSVSNSAGTPTVYPAGFHALASVVPGVDIPIMLNGAVLALAVVPWIGGTALLARALFPRVPWAPFAAATVAALVPASPLNLGVHLSPLPNLSGFAVLPGTIAAAAALWGELTRAERTGSQRSFSARTVTASMLAVGMAVLGLGFLHPNVAVTAMLLLAVLSASTVIRGLNEHPWSLAVPLLALAPVALLIYTPLGDKVTEFSGGLQVPWWSALGEVALGLLTVWPMVLGTFLAFLWWPGLLTSFRSPYRWIGWSWVLFAAIYIDAALDSPLNLSILYYRGQDRVSLPLTMVTTVLVVPGLQWWWRRLPARWRERRSPREGGARVTAPGTAGAVVLTIVCIAITVSSLPARSDNAAKNLDSEYPGRPRFLQEDELAAWKRVAPEMDPSLRVISSPFTGASHMYALAGQQVHFPVAGVTVSDVDRNLIWSVPLAAEDPVYCQSLVVDHGIGYVYQDRTPYAYDSTFSPLDEAGPELGKVLFETDHSRLIEIRCTTVDDLNG
ncbi:DUF6541 family protein [Brachybacterium sp. sponge]|uniref:DUF6541 family protein n=1 Tax=Brachybacterium sp. sponge TaxID=1775432 RepID=UPI0007A423BE|nr:DUF6541 family protein [Brachybacterium sp. sponge]